MLKSRACLLSYQINNSNTKQNICEIVAKLKILAFKIQNQYDPSEARPYDFILQECESFLVQRGSQKTHTNTHTHIQTQAHMQIQIFSNKVIFFFLLKFPVGTSIILYIPSTHRCTERSEYMHISVCVFVYVHHFFLL